MVIKWKESKKRGSNFQWVLTRVNSRDLRGGPFYTLLCKKNALGPSYGAIGVPCKHLEIYIF
jgi:hypothetical protein